MATYFMLGKYTTEAIKEANPDRTEKAGRLVRELGGEIVSIYALLGDYDLVLIVELPDEKTAMKASLALSMLTGVAFSTMPALSISDFDRIIGEK